MLRTMSPLVLLCLALGCAKPDDPPMLERPGDPCRSAYQLCETDNTVLSCIDDVWVERDCDIVCAELGPAYVADGCDMECVCVLVDPSACTPGDTACVDPETMSTCDETQTMQPQSCADLCGDLGLASLGCMDASEEPASCWCTAEGTPCEASQPLCVDAQTLATCEAGVWAFMDCAASCAGAASCDPLASPAACNCE